MWRADNVIAGVSFVRGHRTLQDEVDRTGIDVCYQSLLDALKAVVGTLPNSLAVFEYMRSIFDSYVNPNNDPNVQPLVKDWMWMISPWTNSLVFKIQPLRMMFKRVRILKRT
ncbi:hypothetical protein R1flu_025535 [Riccia fluitans]|uniref:Uncharacterized protein n=1 Tax=Riccia fluitans TaxID=41844 RepID=A0ABD1Y269_9MARC